MKVIKKSINLGDRELTLTIGKLAEQAQGAVLAQYGETVVLATVTSSRLKEDLGYFPLTVEYQERLYAGGRIKGSRWVKRDGRPADDHILSARLIDRSIRPLFPKEYDNEVQVVVTVLSVDLKNDPVAIAPVAVSAALALSPIPWLGPIGSVTVGMSDGKFVANPQNGDLKNSKMELVVSSTDKAIVMIEAGANEASEEDILGGVEFAYKESKKIIKFISDLVKEAGSKKEAIEKEKADPKLESKVKKIVSKELESLAKKIAAKEASFGDLDVLKASMVDHVGEENLEKAVELIEDLFKEEVRSIILGGSRPDGRKYEEIRKLSSEVSVLPRTHGSAIFKRGSTQALTVTTLGAPSLGQLIESAEGEEEKRYIHHYSMPPYATGETGRIGSPGRREIGHGALAERALIPVIPGNEEFPYAIYLVSEIMSSNGSSSMASVCGSTMSLMDAGVPIKRPVSGIAMGLVIDAKKIAILSDIAGIEDYYGDMDFKVAGSVNGITALQLDVKTLSLTPDILKKALSQAKAGRAEILKSMLATIDKAREKVSEHAPKIKSTKIDPSKIGEVIGPGGKTIKNIIATTGADVDVEDDGTVSVSGIDGEKVNEALAWVENLVKEVEPGEIYEGTVKRIESFGAFVAVLPGKEGLVHVSDMSEGFVEDANKVVKLGDKVQVRVKEIDNLGRINLSMILDPSKEKKRPPQRDFRKGGQRRSFNRPRVGRSGSGPHFPTSRLVSQRREKDKGFRR
ncbi:MAG: Polyribonucleotide nucleotidyltransferase [Candidatus Woesebacteria bacterium GW2011_GWB1_43_14]|uniref:Polyribonucleotide nucleotidyltransferase n=1 Tax=Candidatus Woesebacteria bacterium GW2011_GWB1_43_14 TaxID=1618578 RepID=A0A0G1GEX9_9BACT|nr:MAG: Polyribonucleotide nucleotidyltransferase [Candidatus Woesebacteria bacterium GW2011_GWA1_39_11b]KKS97423.1 MAG: Polyribonucleotide nucleotidyltransferase [Candidatus Woesebacteria bacterium GW2011_GWB1_43_14]